jgi:hypothetical protein
LLNSAGVNNEWLLSGNIAIETTSLGLKVSSIEGVLFASD